MSWQVWTAISVVSLSVSVLVQRIVLHKDKVDPYAYAVSFQGIVGALLMIVAVMYGFTLDNIQSVAVPAIIAIVAFGVGHIAYAKTLQLVEASAFSVLFATQAIWIMLLGILLFNESLSPIQIAGALLIFGSVGLLIENRRSLKLTKGTALGLITGVLFGIAITCWSYVGRHVDGISWTAISFVGTATVAFLVKPSSGRGIAPLVLSKELPKLLILGALYGLGSIAMLYAYQLGTFSVVTPLRQSAIIITTLLALLFFVNERIRMKAKLLAALMCFIGVVLIVS
jgi:drug/metabolite transporter (DMT)-like permease